jgi:stage V sporulation protein G
MRISEIKIFPIGEEKLRAFVSIVFDDCFMVNDIKVIQGKDGLFISMPSRRKKNGKFKDVAHPLNSETRQDIENQILAKYRSSAGEGGASKESGTREVEAEKELEQQAHTTSVIGSVPVEQSSDKSLEEVAEMHLQDSFWTD